MMRERPVATAKMTPERASPRCAGLSSRSGRGDRRCVARPSSSNASASSSASTPRCRGGRGSRRRSDGSCATAGNRASPALEVRRLALLAAAPVALQPPLVSLPLGLVHEGSIGRGVATIARPARRGRFHEMPNIKQQEKRVRQAARQRQENLRWRSTAKTLMRRLREAAESGDAEATQTRAPRARSLARPRGLERRPPQEHRRAPQVAGREARRRRARRRVASAGYFARTRDLDERPLELKVGGKPRAALRAGVELGELDRRLARARRPRSSGHGARTSPRRTDAP